MPSSLAGGGGGRGEDFSLGGRGGSKEEGDVLDWVGGGSLSWGPVKRFRLLRASMGSKLGLRDIPESILDGVWGVKEGEKQLMLDGDSITDEDAACTEKLGLKNRFGLCGGPSKDFGVVASLEF